MEDLKLNGAIQDPRTDVEKAQDFSHEEFFGAGSGYVWQMRPEDKWRKYFIRNQNGSGMCGPFAGSKALGINNFIENKEWVNLNTAYIYTKRTNSGPGMWLQELLDIMCKYGAPSDPTLKSDNLTEAQADAMSQFTIDQINEALKYRGKKYFTANPDIDTFGQLVDMGITPILLLRCAFREWTNEPFVDPTVTPDQYDINHFVPGTEATLINDEKRPIIEDSWGQQYGNKGVRVLKAEFFAKRIFAMGYVLDLKNEDIEKPVHNFSIPLMFGSTGSEVIALQKVLQYEKILATHTSTGAALPLGNFLEMTARALKEWQVKHGIMDFANEKDVRKIKFGPKSISLANSLYNA